MKHDVFICHAVEDKGIADVVCEAIEARGVKCWIASRDVAPGTVRAASVNKAIKGARLLMLIYSHHANESHQVLGELEPATAERIPILALRIEDVPPTDAIEAHIGAAHWLYAHTPSLEKQLDKLTHAVFQNLGLPGDITKMRAIGGLPPKSNKSQATQQKEEKYEQTEQPPSETAPKKLAKMVGTFVNPIFLIILLVVMIGVGIIVWHIQKPTENESVDVGTLPDPIESTQEKGKRKARDQAADLVKQADEVTQAGNLDKMENLLNEVMDLDDTAQGLNTVQQKLVDARQAEVHQNEQLEIQRRKQSAKREKIDQLLVSARKNMEANRLVLPASNNALKDYQAILEIDPSNSKAKSGIKTIAERYIGMARDAIDSSYFTKAEQMLSNAETVDAGAPEIQSLREKISAKKENVITQFNNAFTLIEKGDYAGAEQLINQAARLDNAAPRLPEVRDNLDSARQAATRRTETTRSIAKVLQDELKIGGLGPKMVVLPVGDFMMGSTKETDGDERDDDERQHRVTIEKSFAIGQYEVTNAEYRRFRPDHDSGKYSGLNLNGDDQPVVRLSWNDAVAYAKWLSEQTGKTYRLPTEAEWEYAARAKTTARRYWGDDPGQAGAYANVYDRTAKSTFNFNWPHHACDDGYVVTSPVGRFKPNAFKLYDMLGNVWEWTCSEYYRNFGGGEKRCIPDGDALRALRGGSWSNAPSFVRSARRSGTASSDRHSTDGFRLARDI